VATHNSPSLPFPLPELGGQQLLVEEGRWYSTDRLAAAAGSTIALGRVLAVKSGGAFRVGTPYVEGAVVEATVLDDAAKGPKLTIAKFKNKSHYKRKTGHRQPLSTVLITKIA
jgi:large subunit ribosomal protein L21